MVPRPLCWCTRWAPGRCWSWLPIQTASTTWPCRPTERSSPGAVGTEDDWAMETPRKEPAWKGNAMSLCWRTRTSANGDFDIEFDIRFIPCLCCHCLCRTSALTGKVVLMASLYCITLRQKVLDSNPKVPSLPVGILELTLPVPY